jgi:hypothetical protein
MGLNNHSMSSKKQRLPSNTDLPASLSSFRVVIVGEGSGSGWPVTQDFLYGSGTAMSPGLLADSTSNLHRSRVSEKLVGHSWCCWLNYLWATWWYFCTF